MSARVDLDGPLVDSHSQSGVKFTESGVTFTVESHIEAAGPNSYGKDTKRMKEPRPGESLQEAWSQMGGTVEAMSPAPSGTVAVFTKQNLFAKAVHAAFFGHHPLILSPDMIWLTIAQGLANHVDQHAEKLRDRFVHHEGKKELVIERPEFVKGSKANDWEGVFPDFVDLIKANSAEGISELIENDFSTTGKVERVVSYITLMDTVQHYFSYTMCCGCGFPSITLTGTSADWQKIRHKAEQLKEFDLDWWLSALLPALDQFVEAAGGNPDLNFWRSLCMINTGTSFPVYEPLTGWVQVFFPYLISPGRERGFGDRYSEAQGTPKKALVQNEALANYVDSFKNHINVAKFEELKTASKGDRFAPPPQGVNEGVELERFPPAMSSAPFTYKDAMSGKSHKMAFFGGVTCLVQNESGAIEPKVGWAVMDSGECM